MTAGALLPIPPDWRDRPDRPVAHCASGRALTRRRFVADVSGNIGALAQMPGTAAILCTTSLYWFAVGLFALAACRKHVVVAANDLPATLAGLAGHAGAIVTDRERVFPGAQCRLAQAGDATDMTWPGIDLAAPISFFTSGSTSTPKRVDKQLHHLVAEAQAVSALFAARQPHFRSVCGTVSHHHAYGLAFRLIWPLMSGLPFRDDTPELLEPALAQLDQGAVFVTSPAHLHRLGGLAPLPSTRQPACILSAGSPLGADAAQQARALFGCAVTEIYGSTETGALACRQHDRPEEAWRALPGVQLVAAPSGHAEAVGTHIPGGRAQLADHLRLRGEAGFDLLGRQDRVAKIEAKRVSLDEVEARLRELDEVEDAIVVVHGDPARLAACVVPSSVGANFLANHGAFRFNRRIRAALATRLEAASLPRHWRFVERLPSGPLGKVSRQDVEKLFGE